MEAYLDEPDPLTRTSELDRCRRRPRRPLATTLTTTPATTTRSDEPAGRPAKRKGRASVPSWDEIMFGGGKHD